MQLGSTSVVEDDGPARFRGHGRGRRRSSTPLAKPTQRRENRGASLARGLRSRPEYRPWEGIHLVGLLRHGPSESAAEGLRQGLRRRQQGRERAQETGPAWAARELWCSNGRGKYCVKSLG